MDIVCESSYCGSRSFIVGDDGFTYCSEGHRQAQTGLVTAEDDERPNTGRKTIRKPDNTQTILTGRLGLEHFLVCFQLVLRKQAHALVTNHDYPAALQDIVRDIWVTKLDRLRSRLRSTAEDGEDGQTETFSSQVDTSDSEDVSGRKDRDRDLKELPRIIDGDMLSLVQQGDLIFYQALQHLDTGMRSRLDARYHSSLNPRRLLTMTKLREHVTRTIQTFEVTLDLSVPRLNAELCMWRLVTSFGLPIEIFPAALRMLRLLHLDLDFTRKGTARKPPSSLSWPERQVFAVFMMITKLLYPFDGRSRTPIKPSEPAAMVMDWTEWSQQMAARQNDDRGSTYEQALKTIAADVPDMAGERVDDYLGWFEKAFTGTNVDEQTSARRTRNLTDALHRLFPVGPRTLHDISEASIARTEPNSNLIRDTQNNMRASRVVPQSRSGVVDDLVRPGNDYRRLRSEDELKGPIKEFYSGMRRVSGMTVQSLVRITLTVERLAEGELLLGEK